MIRFFRWVRANGGWRFFVRLLFQGYQGGAAAANGPFGWQWGPAAGQQQGAGHPGSGRRRVTVEEVAEALAKLPTEAYLNPQQMAALSVHELKALLHGRGLEPVKCLEKGELVRQLLEHGGSSAESCSICCEEYAPQQQQVAATPAEAVSAAGAVAAGGAEATAATAGPATEALAADAGPRGCGGGAGPTHAAALGGMGGERGALSGASGTAQPEAGCGPRCGAGCGGGGAGSTGADSGCSKSAATLGGASSGAAAAAAAADDDTPVVLRVLRCGHRFHVECVDKWFLSATDYTREPSCPLCNAPLIPRNPQQA
ncbi:hypothetical protein HYH02_006233 [Chlamydomonas schloesseri]|uniref:RING-type domain-containing protein n=1 Tax=Chlamydomonas schloesseri TaxID=2026947 RepID=A0A836B6P1_9CHLO|nr:hypothetical protein HYH02_006233 [Chlamydomonas schloesseri]|eukprot:KAG2448884.1 hypothetical protein HYH02_006233 [Chlamydomonas schloesseri]